MGVSVLIMRRHVPSKILLPQEFLSANITVEIPITDMLYHVHLQHDVVKEPHIADVAFDLFLPQMDAPNMVVHEGIPREHTTTVFACGTQFVHRD